MSTCVVVLGTMRSGSSAVAGALHKAGISMGKFLMPGNEFNERGYYEDEEFYALPPLPDARPGPSRSRTAPAHRRRAPGAG